MTSTKERLAEAIREFNPNLTDMIQRAEEGYYDDYESPHEFPISQLVKDFRAVGANELAKRAVDGEFDATKEEAEAWFEREGQYLI